ncbi:MAG: aminotransferase class V-fold PLP-dependent enzyme [Spartobacteria bacterium]
MIYLDNNATTQLDPAALEEMMPFLTTSYGNPSSGYRFATRIRQEIDRARERVAALLGCDASEIVFTSGGTEANNTALNSALRHEPRGKHMVISAVEHSAVRRHAEELAARGCEVTEVGVNQDGDVDLAEIERAIRPHTAIVSFMWANNETGVLFPVEKIAAICREKGVLFHTDAVQAVGKLPMRLGESAITFLSLAAHKFHGPKGVGALYVSKRVGFHASVFGGSHERGRRAGTENVPAIIGMGKAAERAAECLGDEHERVCAMRDKFEATVVSRTTGATINGRGAARLFNTSNISFANIEAQAALLLLDRHRICCSAGSACKTGSSDGSHVLRAMKGSAPDGGSLRFSFGRFNSNEDLEESCITVPEIIEKLRRLSEPAEAGSESRSKTVRAQL